MHIFFSIDRSNQLRSITVYDSDGYIIENLGLGERGVQFTLPVANQSDKYDTQCAFWDQSKWNTSGCETLNLRGKDEALVRCKCNHLTTFGLIVSVERHQGHHHLTTTEEAITMVGCIISAVALLMTTAFFAGQILMAKGKPQVRNRINFHLTANLFVVELLIIISFQVDTGAAISYFTESLCTGIAVSLHFFLLSTFAWMLFAGYQIYVMLVRVFDPDDSQSITKYRICGYLVPLTALMLAITLDQALYDGRTYYGIENECWMKPNGLYTATFFVPVIGVLIFNIGMITLALVKVCGIRPRPKALGQARGFLSLVFLLGGTWVGELIRVNIWPNNVTLMYISTALNSLQGLFIFLFYVLLSKACRVNLKKRLKRRRKRVPTSDKDSSDETGKM